MSRLYFIIGCTASGKGAVGRAIAQRTGACIVSVDSMKIYRRMDLGTAKPSMEIRREIPHYCIDIVEPAEGFSVARYVNCADTAIREIAESKQTALAVGGTSLYIKALSEGLFEAPPTDPQLRSRLKARASKNGLEAMHAELTRVDPEAASRIHANDERRIIRALEVYHTTGKPISELQRQWDTGKLRYNCVFVGLRRPGKDLNSRINSRTRRIVQAGLREEVASLLAEPEGLSSQAAAAVGYAEMIAHLRGECSLEEAVERIKINTRRLGKKQRTWQRRFDNVLWFDIPADEDEEKTAERILSEVNFKQD